MFMTVNYIFHTERNWLVPLRVIKVIKITKADFYRSWETGFKFKKYTIAVAIEKLCTKHELNAPSDSKATKICFYCL